MYIIYVQLHNPMNTTSKYNYNAGDIICTKEGKPTFLKYLSEAPASSYRKRKVLVQCKCGKEWTAQLGNILNGTTFTCGKYPCRTYKSLYADKRDPEVGFRALFYVYKKHATERNLEFLLTYEQFKTLLGNNCHYCGQEPSQVYKLTKKGTDEIRSGVPIVYNGIDRINSDENYTVCNVVTACKRCNVAKMDQTYEEYIERVQRIYQHLQLKDYKKNELPFTSCP